MRLRFLGVAFSVGMLLAPIAHAASRSVVVGEPAPDFDATTINGEKLHLADFKGQVLVLNFWATWCEPCKKELPLLDAYYRAQKDFGLRILAVTTEDSAPIRKLRPLAEKVAFPMLRWMGGPYHQMEGVPTNYIIDRSGVVRYAKAKAFTIDDLNAILVPLLREPTPDADTGPASANP